MHACSGDYSVRLPGGYALTRVHAKAVVIHHPEKGIVVDADIDGYKVLGDIVVGRVIMAERAPDNAYSKPGYFFLITKTHEVKQGLDKKAWLESLQKIGISDEPNLGKPSPFDRDYQ
jgi:hypothetical protein